MLLSDIVGLMGPSKGLGDRQHGLKMWQQTIFKAPTSDRNYQEKRENLRQRQFACCITKLTYNFSFCSKVTATFSTMEQATEQLQNERQATQDTPLEGPSIASIC